VRGDPLLGAADAGDVDAVEEHRELAALESSAESVLTEVRETEAALLEALVIEDEATIVPGEHLGSVAAPADEDEEVAGVEVLLPLVADDGGESVNGIAHVHPLGSEQDADSARDEKHVGPELPQRVHEKRHVLRVGADADPDDGAILEGDFYNATAPRLWRGRGYHLHWHESGRRVGVQNRLSFLLFVEPKLERAERHVVLGDEFLLSQAALLVLR
jgi:hypothetical protein